MLGILLFIMHENECNFHDDALAISITSNIRVARNVGRKYQSSGLLTDRKGTEARVRNENGTNSWFFKYVTTIFKYPPKAKEI